MLFRSFAQLILLVFCFVVLLVAPLIAGFLGVFGSNSQQIIAQYWDELVRYRDPIQKSFAAIGAAVTFIGGALGVYKTWHYAEINLPARLSELVERWQEVAVRKRLDVVPALANSSTIKPVAATRRGVFRRLLDWLFNPDQRDLLHYQAEFSRHKAELRVLSMSRSRCRAELVTAQLAVATRLARLAPSRSHEALKAFQKSLRFNSTDLDALELMAKQQFALGSTQQASAYLEKMVAAASNSKNELRLARARRYQAEILHESEIRADWDRARAILLNVIRVLSEADSHDANKLNCELALAHEVLANVQLTRERLSAATIARNEAKRLFSGLPAPYGTEGLRRIEAFSKELDEAKNDKDSSNGED